MARQAFRQYYKSSLESFLQKNHFLQSGMEVSPLSFQLKDLNGKIFRKQRLNGGDSAVECIFAKHVELLSRITVPLQHGEPVLQINIPAKEQGAHAKIFFDLPDHTDFIFSYPLPDVPPHIDSYEK